jgi:CRISPR-associated endonuclease/helicase Cas3
LRYFFSHSANEKGQKELLSEHLQLVATRAERYGQNLGMGKLAYTVGLLHDLGKYGERFQLRLEGKESGIDHWSAGALALLLRCKGRISREALIAGALAIEGHHVGLSKPGCLHELPKRFADGQSRLDRRFSQEKYDLDQLWQYFESCGLELPAFPDSAVPWKSEYAAFALATRMLFSVLVDSDYIESEANSQAKQPEEIGRDVAPDLRPTDLLAVLRKTLLEKARDSQASPAMQAMRADLQDACRIAASEPVGIKNLAAPTSSGKTLAMLLFALEHAARWNLRRIVIVVPYLTILDETATEYRALVEQAFPGESDRYLLEHHSLAGSKDDGKEQDDSRRRLLAENWDAPIILTTNVQLLESLHSNYSVACRKLHRLAESVVLLDEVQTIPRELAVLTLATLSHLSAQFRTTVVMATATQPAFRSLDPGVRTLSPEGWCPTEIAPASLNLFQRIRRTVVQWPEPDEHLFLEQLASEIRQRLSDRKLSPQLLCIVNLKKHAQKLAAILSDCPGLKHLSTNLCLSHRKPVLADVKSRLKENAPCLLISTQCVEAGVNLDFPDLCRSTGPLDALAQAVGRCNRHGRRPELGRVRVFRLDASEGLYPNASYGQATSVTESLLAARGAAGMNLDDPALYERYYRELYLVSATGQGKQDLMEAVRAKDFESIAKLYRLIEPNLSVLVPYAPEMEKWERLRAQARGVGINRQWIQQAQSLAVNVYRPAKEDADLWSHLEPVRLAYGGESPDWFLLRNADDYDPTAGLQIPNERIK